ncbi:MAG: PilZ domain-containing protein [Nitrospirota bacterium]|nr:PilZ domain-containing protein [Nitrospirota bacterium]MDP2383134.1 PilZ domain-containing protein [Nitrospirota bacterium]MDP3598254.1 PilZ domain-containing protein [Nitrospirota bacterium]
MRTASPITAVAECPNQSDRRHRSRTPTIFTLLYSGMASSQMLIADGVVTNLSAKGIGIRGNRSVALGMELSLFVDLPGLEEPLCIGQSLVSWVEGRHFGVKLGDMKSEDMHHLQLFLWDHSTPSSNSNGSN